MNGSGVEGKGHVLVIEDDVLVRRSVAAYLEDCGYRVTEAGDGHDGVEIFRHRDVDLVITDLRMPGMHGLDVLSTLRQEAEEVPVLVVSGTGVLGDVVEALRRGAWDYLTKPIVEMGVLEHAVTRALERARLLREHRHYQERLEAEVVRRTQQLENLVEEKTVLLQEVHHRVKNNLQVISSLLQIKARATEAPEVRRFFSECCQRIRSMALIHDALYQTADFARIDFGSYLQRLVVDVVQSYGVMAEGVVPRVEAEPLAVGMDLAVPCALIVHELLSNCLKYAFPPGQGGVVVVSLRSGGGGQAELVVRDDGVGLSEKDVGGGRESLGLQIVQLLVQQISGTLECHSGHGTGTTLTIRFPLGA